MADSCREQIVCAALKSLKTIDDITVERNRRDALTDEELPSLILFEGPELPLNDFSSEDSYRLSLLVQGSFKGKPADVARDANNMRAMIIKTMMADVSLGGLARNLEISDPGDWIGTPTESDDTEGFVLQFDVTYATKEFDPFTFENN